jgi:[acyl-carrier-protein] S-malonyltransferase
MQPAKEELEKAIAALSIQPLRCPIYQNVKARAERDPESIQQNLIDQLTAPVRWTQTMEQMIRDGATEFIEAGGTGKTLQGFVKKVDRRFPTSAL